MLQRREIRSVLAWPLVVGACAAAVTVLVWQGLVADQELRMARFAALAAQQAVLAVETRIGVKLEVLRNLESDWSRFGLPSPSQWEQDVYHAMELHPGLESIAWVDLASGERRVAAGPGGREVSLDDARVRDALEQARLEGRVRAVGPADLAGDAAERLVVCMPLAHGSRGERSQLLVASLRLDTLLVGALEGGAPGFAVRILSGERLLVQRGEPALDASLWTQRERVAIPQLDLAWALEVAPGAKRVAAELTPAPAYVLAAGLLASALLATTVAAAALARRRARALERAHAELSASHALLQQDDAAIRRLNLELEQRVAERTSRLNEAVAELEAFNYSVSHDLRSPLGAIVNFAAILREDHPQNLDDASRRYVARIQSSAAKALSMMDGLLAFSRLGREELKRAPVDVERLVRETVDELRARAPGPAPSVEIGALPPTRGDATMLGLVFSNLLGNAFKFTRGRPDPRVEVGALRSGRTHVYFVKDNGIGFDMRFADKLFGVFERLHASDEFEGDGVGLAIAGRIVRRHGGSIWAEGEPGRGATFFLSLGEDAEA